MKKNITELRSELMSLLARLPVGTVAYDDVPVARLEDHLLRLLARVGLPGGARTRVVDVVKSRPTVTSHLKLGLIDVSIYLYAVYVSGDRDVADAVVDDNPYGSEITRINLILAEHGISAARPSTVETVEDEPPEDAEVTELLHDIDRCARDYSTGGDVWTTLARASQMIRRLLAVAERRESEEVAVVVMRNRRGEVVATYEAEDGLEEELRLGDGDGAADDADDVW